MTRHHTTICYGNFAARMRTPVRVMALFLCME